MTPLVHPARRRLRSSATVSLEKLPAIDESLIATINADPSSTWTAGVNAKFVNKTLAYAKRLCGTKTSAERKAALPVNPAGVLPADAIPASFNATQAWPKCAGVIGHIRDQSGAC